MTCLSKRWFALPLEESNEQIKNILESISDGFIAVDQEWRCTYANGKATELSRARQEGRELQRWLTCCRGPCSERLRFWRKSTPNSTTVERLRLKAAVQKAIHAPGPGRRFTTGIGRFRKNGVVAGWFALQLHSG